MNTTIIEYDNKKRIRTLLCGILLILVCLFFLYFMVFLTRRLSLPFAAVCVGLIFYFIYIIYIGIKQLLSDDKAGLILNDEGCFFKQSKVGIVKWADVVSLSVKRENGIKAVFLELVNPDKYANKEGISEAIKNSIKKNGINISSSELAISFNELHALIEKYFELYKKHKIK